MKNITSKTKVAALAIILLSAQSLFFSASPALAATAAPIITTPSQTVTTSSIVITGTAAVNAAINISGGTSVGNGTAYGGNFSVTVNLNPGVNTLSATANDGSGESPATIVVITYNPPAQTFTITATAGPNGAISPSGVTTLNLGAGQSYTITPNVGYAVADVSVNAVSVGPVTTFNFPAVNSNNTISAIFAIAPLVLTSITVAPATASIAAGASQQFAATALDQYGAALATQPSFTWTTSDNTVATIDTAGLATGVAAGGPIIITAASGAISGTASLTVTQTPAPPVLTTITVSPATTSIAVGATQQFNATGYDQNGTALPTQPAFTWTSSDNTIAAVDTAGLATGVAAGGPVTITAASGTISGTASLTVTQAPTQGGSGVASITVTPATANIFTGASQQFTATAYDSGGEALDTQPTFTWTSASSTIATINSAGLAAGVASGTTAIMAASGTVSGTASLTVVQAPPVLTSITVSPAAAFIPASTTKQFTAVAYDQYGMALIVQPVFTWSSASTTVATVNSSGLATGLTDGTASITASSGSVSSAASLTVSTAAPALASITVSPATATVPVGLTKQFTATGYDQYGMILAAQPTFIWSSASSTIATVDSNGLATGAAIGGPIDITAASSTVSGMAQLTVTAAPALASINVSPSTATTTPGQTVQFTASALDQYGAALATQPTFTWASASSTIATINASGLAAALSVGMTSITASSSAITGTATLNIVTPVLTTISVSPAAPTVKIGETLQMHALGLDQSGVALIAQPSFAWTSASSTVASISAGGLVTGLSVGTSTISAASGAITGTSLLTVSTSTKIELQCDSTHDIDKELEDSGSLVPELGEDYATTTALIATHDVHITIHATAGDDTVDLPDGVRITSDDGSNVDGRNLIASSTDETTLSGLGSSLVVEGALRWGMSNKTLTFNLPISLGIYVGAAFNGQTLSIYRSPDGATGWTSDGIVAPATYLVANGICSFQATKASYYASTAPAPVTPPSGGGGGGGGGGDVGGNSIVGGSVISTGTQMTPTESTGSSDASVGTTDQSGGQVLGQKIYADGSLLRGPDMNIYLITGGNKMRILNLQQLALFKGQAIFDVSADVLAAYPDTANTLSYANGMLIRTPDKKIFVIVNGLPKHILNLKQLQKYAGKPILDVSSNALRA